MNSLWIIRIQNLCDRIVFAHLKRRGIQTAYWVLNTKEDVERAMKGGVDCVMTDCPSVVKGFVRKKIDKLAEKVV